MGKHATGDLSPSGEPRASQPNTSHSMIGVPSSSLSASGEPASGQRRGLAGRLAGRLALALAVLVTVAGGVILVGPQDSLARLPWAGASSCETRNVDMVVSPELRGVVSQIVEPARGRSLPGGAGLCIGVQVRSQEPQETAASAEILPLSRAPQIWIPDASSWAGTVTAWKMTSPGSLASTPVVLATSAAAVKALGWDVANPSWRKALRGARPVAVPDYQAQSESLDALLALWQTLGKNARAEKQVVATVLASDRQEVPSPEAAIADARSGTVQAPLIPSTEQNVAALNAASTSKNLVAVYPREGSPRLDYPILAITGAASGAAPQEAVDAVLAELTSPRAQDLLRAAGFRDTQGRAPAGTGIRPDYTLELPRPDDAQVEGMLARIGSLAKPSRILAVYDVSRSMSARLADGVTRIALAGAASRLGVNLLPDSSYVGAWIFAARMGGGKDYRVLAPVQKLADLTATGESNRSQLARMAGNFNSYLSDGGTALYDVTDAAFAQMHKDFDPKAVNAIILLSDGSNDDPGSMSLSTLAARLRAGNAGPEKVAIYTGALGPDADSEALRQIASASNGHFYTINDAADGQRALLDGLRRSRNIG